MPLKILDFELEHFNNARMFLPCGEVIANDVVFTEAIPIMLYPEI